MKQFVKNILKGSYLLRFYSNRIRHKRFDLNSCGNIVKVNLGCGLKVCKGYVNVDYNIPCLFANISTMGLTFIYYYLKMIRYSELKRPYRFSVNREKFIDIMQNNKFIFFSLLNGVPFDDNSVDHYYSSHMIGFGFPQSASKSILKDVYRTLKNNGSIRLSLGDGDHYWAKKGNKIISEKYNTDDNCFTYSEMEIALKEIGFGNIKKWNYGQGNYPDINELDDYSPEVDKAINSRTMYIEAAKL